MSKRPNVLMAVFLAWLIPGGGHWYLGKRVKAMLFFVLVSSTFVVGLAMMDFALPPIAENPQNFAMQIFIGLPVLLGHFFSKNNNQQIVTEFTDLGNLYTWIASLLNLLILIQVYAKTAEELWKS